jgi:NTE family protein
VGYSPDTIRSIIRAQDWNSFISDVQEREFVSYEEKLFGEKYIYSMPIEGKGLSLSKSINSSFNIDLMLNRLFAPVAHITDFTDLTVPFLCIGTDLLTGEAVILQQGNLARAVRASMAIPGYFSPTEYQGHYLIDGGVVNNYPAEQVKAMGAEIIIGGDVQTGLKKDIEEISSITSILDQVISFNRVDANIKGFELTDYHIKIPMDYGMLDFDQYDSIIAIGERVAREHYPQLKALADSLNHLGEVLPRRKRTQLLDSVDINEIVWKRTEIESSQNNHRFFDDVHHTKTSLSEFEYNMKLLNGTGIYNELKYELVPTADGKMDVQIDADHINKGSVAAGIHYNNVYGGSVLLNLTLRNIKGGRSKLFTDVVLGRNPRVKSMFIINNGFKPGFGMEADFFALKFSEYNEGDKINTWDFDNFSFSAFMPITIKNNYLLKAGIKYELFRFKQDVVVDPDLDAYNKFADYGNVFVTFDHDSRDKVNFPTRGQLVKIQGKHVFPFSDQWNDLLSNATIVSLRYNWYLSLGKRVVFKPELFAGYTFTDKITPFTESANTNPQVIVAPIQHLFAFGGVNTNNYLPSHISFTGIKYIEKFGMYAGKFSTNLEYNFYNKLYAGIIADIGFIDNELHTIADIDYLIGYGARLSYDSFVGPIEFTVSSSNVDNSINAFVNLGFWF